jgi:hypothetical protein
LTNTTACVSIAPSTTKEDKQMIINTKNFEIKLPEYDGNIGTGWFEHKTMGDHCGGMLKFIDRELVDFDGVYILKDEVIDALIRKGYEAESMRYTDGYID